jgi:hypothetical protein
MQVVFSGSHNPEGREGIVGFFLHVGHNSILVLQAVAQLGLPVLATLLDLANQHFRLSIWRNPLSELCHWSRGAAEDRH